MAYSSASSLWLERIVDSGPLDPEWLQMSAEGRRVLEEGLGIDGYGDAVMIDQGGFSDVYAANQKGFNRRVAIKVLRGRLDDRDRERFDRECETMGGLSWHPNVVTVFTGGYTTNDQPYLIMELIEGGTLADLLRRDGPLTWSQAIDYLIPVADALGEAHRAGIIHRDVKPENILLAADRPMLTDFGIAQLRDITHMSNTPLASWRHTAPETLESRRDERSDLYSLASTLFTLIDGNPPIWREEGDTLQALMLRLVSEDSRRLADHLAPPELCDLLASALARDPDERPQSTTEFIEKLASIRATGRTPAPPGDLALTRSEAPEPPVVADVPPGPDARNATRAEPHIHHDPPEIGAQGPPTGDPPPRDDSGRRRPIEPRIMFVGATVVIAIAAVIAVIATQSGSDDPPDAGAQQTSTTEAPSETETPQTPSSPATPTVRDSIRQGIITWEWNEPSGRGRDIVGYDVVLDGGSPQFQTGRSFVSPPYGPFETHQLRVTALTDLTGEPDSRSSAAVSTVDTGGDASFAVGYTYAVDSSSGFSVSDTVQQLDGAQWDLSDPDPDTNFSIRCWSAFNTREYVVYDITGVAEVVNRALEVTLTEHIHHDPTGDIPFGPGGEIVPGEGCGDVASVAVVAEQTSTHTFPAESGTYDLPRTMLEGPGITATTQDRTITITVSQP